MAARGKENGKYQGMNWISKKKRLAIYLRDGLSCVWCGSGVEGGARMTLDHLVPYSQGGTNQEHNLVTCCSRCNSARGDRHYHEFASAVAGYLDHGVTGAQIVDRIDTLTASALDTAEAGRILDRRASWSDTLAQAAQQ
jgi:hypothetical protein